MVASTVITDYFGEGLHSARPATPNVPTGCTAIYYETDTTNTFAWSGSAWVQINGTGGGSTATVVQVAANGSGLTSVGATFATAPTAGNLLIAFVFNGGAASVNGTGWTAIKAGGGAVDDETIGFKIAGASEPTTQLPSTDASNGCVVIFEINGGIFGTPSLGAGSSTAQSITFPVWKAPTLYVGVIDHAATGVTLSSTTNMATHTFVNGTLRNFTYFTSSQSTPGLTAGSVTATIASSTSFIGGVVGIG